MANPYPSDQCTAGAADIFPCLQDTGKYGNFGNGGDWFSHAQSIGLQTDSQPHVGWLASFHNMGEFGHVAQIKAINPDGTLTIFGRNFKEDGKDSEDKVPAADLTGSFNPPCAATDGTNATLDTAQQGNSGLPDFTKMGQELQGAAMVTAGLLIAGLAIGLVLLGTREGSKVTQPGRRTLRQGRRYRRSLKRFRAREAGRTHRTETAQQGTIKKEVQTQTAVAKGFNRAHRATGQAQRRADRQEAQDEHAYRQAQREGRAPREGESQEDMQERGDMSRQRRAARKARGKPEGTDLSKGNSNARERLEELRRLRRKQESREGEGDEIPF